MFVEIEVISSRWELLQNAFAVMIGVPLFCVATLSLPSLWLGRLAGPRFLRLLQTTMIVATFGLSLALVVWTILDGARERSFFALINFDEVFVGSVMAVATVLFLRMTRRRPRPRNPTPTPLLWRMLIWILPNRLFYADRFTVSAKKLFARMAIGVGGIGGGLLSTGLVDSKNWAEVLGGALLAWAVSVIVWAVSSYRRERDEIRTDLRRNAELDLLHARLNQIAVRVGAPLLILDYQLEHSVGARMERLAHFTGLDEFREEAHTTADGYAFWDPDALGYGVRYASDVSTPSDENDPS